MTAAVGAADARDAGPKTERWSEASERWALWTFAAVIAIAVPVILYQGRRQWFYLDDWDFLADRQAGSLHDLMTPHVGHWSAFGVVLYRALWQLVGLNHYWPYQLSTVTLRLAAAVMLRAIMRRAGVHPWIATTAAALFVFFGSGFQNIIMAIGVTFMGALAFGLAHILLADHDGPFDRRDAVGIGFGLLALMCSAVGVAMAAGAGAAIFMRRGWRVAAAHVAPLAAAFALWSATFGRGSVRPPGPAAAVAFVWNLFVDAFDGIGHYPGVGIVLAIAVVVGTPLALSRQTWEESRRLYGPTAGLAFAAVSFTVLTAYRRAEGAEGISPSRYVDLVVALCLPVVALALSALVARWRATLPMAIAILLIGVPANIRMLDPENDQQARLGDPALVLTMAHLPLAQSVPPELRPLNMPEGDFRIGWLIQAVADGRVPPAPEAHALTLDTARLRLSVYQTDAVPPGQCRDIQPGELLSVHRGDVIRITGYSVTLQSLMNGRRSASATYKRFVGASLQIVGTSLDVTVESVPPAMPARLCR